MYGASPKKITDKGVILNHNRTRLKEVQSIKTYLNSAKDV